MIRVFYRNEWINIVWSIENTHSFLVAYVYWNSDKGDYTNSVYWGRHTTTIIPGIEESFYPVIQLIDANGTKIEPAYANWLRDQSQEDTSGKTHPNENFFCTLDGDSRLSKCVQQL